MAEEMKNVESTQVEETNVVETKNNVPEISLEEQLKAMQAENARFKKAIDKLTSEASGLRKENKSLKSSEQLKEEEQAERNRKLAIYEKMENLQTVYQNMNAETARKIAELEADGDFNGVHEVMNEYVEALVKQKSTDALLNRQRVNAGSGNIQITKEQFHAMSMEERSKLYNDNKAEYERLKNLK